MNQRTEVELNRIYVGDCIELMRKLPDGCASLIIADPPYNLGKSFGNWREWRDVDQWLPWCKSWLSECKRILKMAGAFSYTEFIIIFAFFR